MPSHSVFLLARGLSALDYPRRYLAKARRTVSTKSPTSRGIDRIIGTRPKALLRTHGFRKDARTFHLHDAPLVKLINFQHSWLNKPEEAQFTVNVDITMPFFHETWTGHPLPRNPGSAAAVIHRRMGHLTPDNLDLWWTVTPETDTEPIAAEIEQLLINYALPFLEQFQTIGHLIDRVDTDSKPPYTQYNRDVVAAILLKALGRDDDSKERLRSAKAVRKNKPFARTIETIQQRLGFTIAK